ncbi:MAG: hypothetical protein II782_07270, partial [Oscillospiraceae bacterium]|nr:hypothetical protein [Oscillospiraceae bacterium]
MEENTSYWYLTRDVWDTSKKHYVLHCEGEEIYETPIDLNSDDPKDNYLKGAYDIDFDLSKITDDDTFDALHGTPGLVLFDNVMGVRGVRLSFALSADDDMEKYADYYFTVYNGKIVCIAQTYGTRDRKLCEKIPLAPHISRDTDGDGVCEFIACNGDYNNDGLDIRDAVIYRVKDGKAYAGHLKLPENAYIQNFEVDTKDKMDVYYGYTTDKDVREKIPLTDEYIEYKPYTPAEFIN